jgi:hypothetical protein
VEVTQCTQDALKTVEATHMRDKLIKLCHFIRSSCSYLLSKVLNAGLIEAVCWKETSVFIGGQLKFLGEASGENILCNEF